ncbi:MAG TPA: hypothetical protein VIW24_00665 [Aldersonia sp.]
MTITAQPVRIEELDAHFQKRRHQVPVLARRAQEAGTTAIRTADDVLPLLFPHTTYKSYPESLVSKGRWEQLNRWLDSLSTYRVDVDVDGVADVDGWIAHLEEAGHLVSSSSGTSGKGSFLDKSARDREVSLQNLLDCLTGMGLPPDRSWNFIPVGPETRVSQHVATRDLLVDSFHRRDGVALPPSAAPEGHHRYMSRLSAMRKAMADGTASPDEVAAFEAEAAQRQQLQDGRLSYLAEQILARPTERFFFSSQFPQLFRLTEVLRELGASDGDLTGGNALTVAGGLKGVTLPPDYRERIFGILNIAPERFLHYYSMQELNLRMPKCLAGRYHVPAGLHLFVLDRDGESLVPLQGGVAEGRAAFFDTTVDGRWGGTISGDKVVAEYGECSCGRPGITIHDDIARFSDLHDDDKITCAGTMDAYVRGFIEG